MVLNQATVPQAQRPRGTAGGNLPVGPGTKAFHCQQEGGGGGPPESRPSNASPLLCLVPVRLIGSVYIYGMSMVCGEYVEVYIFYFV